MVLVALYPDERSIRATSHHPKSTLRESKDPFKFLPVSLRAGEPVERLDAKPTRLNDQAEH